MRCGVAWYGIGMMVNVNKQNGSSALLRILAEEPFVKMSFSFHQKASKNAWMFVRWVRVCILCVCSYNVNNANIFIYITTAHKGAKTQKHVGVRRVACCVQKCCSCNFVRFRNSFSSIFFSDGPLSRSNSADKLAHILEPTKISYYYACKMKILSNKNHFPRFSSVFGYADNTGV